MENEDFDGCEVFDPKLLKENPVFGSWSFWSHLSLPTPWPGVSQYYKNEYFQIKSQIRKWSLPRRSWCLNVGEIGLSRSSISSLFISSIVFQFELLISTNIALTTSTSLNASLGLGHFTTLKLSFFRGETQAEEKRFQRRTNSLVVRKN